VLVHEPENFEFYSKEKRKKIKLEGRKKRRERKIHE
jgi:hypothetical protein